jgi:hypothetical protein
MTGNVSFAGARWAAKQIQKKIPLHGIITVSCPYRKQQDFLSFDR